MKHWAMAKPIKSQAHALKSMQYAIGRAVRKDKNYKLQI